MLWITILLLTVNISPTLIFDKKEEFFPCDPFFAGDVNKDGVINIEDIKNYSNPFDERNNYVLYKKVFKTKAERISNITIFTKHLPDKDVIEYWFYYPMNIWFNVHYRDWEKFYVFRNKLVIADAHDYFVPPSYRTINSHTFNVFIEKGSHASCLYSTKEYVLGKTHIFDPFAEHLKLVSFWWQPQNWQTGEKVKEYKVMNIEEIEADFGDTHTFDDPYISFTNTLKLGSLVPSVFPVGYPWQRKNFWHPEWIYTFLYGFMKQTFYPSHDRKIFLRYRFHPHWELEGGWHRKDLFLKLSKARLEEWKAGLFLRTKNDSLKLGIATSRILWSSLLNLEAGYSSVSNGFFSEGSVAFLHSFYPLIIGGDFKLLWERNFTCKMRYLVSLVIFRLTAMEGILNYRDGEGVAEIKVGVRPLFLNLERVLNKPGDFKMELEFIF
jgi:hypothetical protein